MFTRTCKHCGATFQAERPNKRFCSPYCQAIGNRIARFGHEQPATYDHIPHYCNLPMLMIQNGERW